MRKFLIGLISGVALSALIALILIFAFIRLVGSFGERPVNVADGSTLVLKLDGDLPEKSPPEIPIPLFEAQTPMTVQEVWDMLHKAASDSRIKGILFEPQNLDIGWAKLEEIHDEILQFRKSGKPVVTFLKNPGAREYYLAVATDRVFLAPEDTLDLKGLRLETVYLKNTLDKLGVKADVIHAGKYKDAGDVFTKTAMSPETREVLTQVLDQYYGDLTDTIAQGRGQSPEALRALVDQGPFLAKDALASHLVDSLGYEEQAAEEMKSRLKQSELKRLSSRGYLKVPWPGGGAVRQIALVVGEGTITRGTGNSSADEQGITDTAMIKLLKQVGDDASVKGVILRVDSPGGDGVASDNILHAAKDLSKKKPLVISMSDLAASGGYFISVTGDPIIAYPNTLTGSIGVIFVRMSLHGLFDKIGFDEQSLSRGRYANIDSSTDPLTEDERQKVAGQVDAFYKSFVNRVAEGRKKTFDQIEPLAQGRVWLGVQARQNGLVDDLGGLDKAVELIRQRAHIASTDRVALVAYPGKRSVLDMLFNRADESSAIDLKLERLLGKLPVTALTRGGFLKVLPYTIKVR